MFDRGKDHHGTTYSQATLASPQGDSASVARERAKGKIRSAFNQTECKKESRTRDHCPVLKQSPRRPLGNPQKGGGKWRFMILGSVLGKGAELKREHTLSR